MIDLVYTLLPLDENKFIKEKVPAYFQLECKEMRIILSYHELINQSSHLTSRQKFTAKISVK